MASPEFIQAMRGTRMTAADYAGMTPEQMQAVHGTGMQNKQMALGMWQMQQQQAAQERQEQFQREQFAYQQEQDQFRNELLSRQDFRADLQMLSAELWNHKNHDLQTQKLSLEKRLADSTISMNNMKMTQIKSEMQQLERQQEGIRHLAGVGVNVAGQEYTIGELYTAGMPVEKIMSAVNSTYAANMSNPSAQVQKWEYFKGYARQAGVNDPLLQYQYSFIAAQAEAMTTRAEMHELLMKNDTLYALNINSERNRKLLDDAMERFRTTEMGDQAALLEFFKTQQMILDNTPEAERMPEHVRLGNAVRAAELASQETPKAASEQPAVDPGARDFVREALGEPREIDPAYGATNIFPYIAGHAQAVKADRDYVLQTTPFESVAPKSTAVAEPASTTEPVPSTPQAVASVESQAAPAKPAPAARPRRQDPLEQSSGLISRSRTYQDGNVKKSVGTPQRVVREGGKTFIEYSGGLRQEIQQAVQRQPWHPYEVTFLDGSTATFRP